MTEQERQFEEVATEALRECQRLGYNPGYTIDIIQRLGSYLAASRDMLSRPTDPTGLTRLYELGRLDLSVEALTLRPEFSGLFTATQLAVARRRLQELGYPLPTAFEGH